MRHPVRTYLKCFFLAVSVEIPAWANCISYGYFYLYRAAAAYNVRMLLPKYGIQDLLPVVYGLLVAVAFLGHAQGAGHGKSLQIFPFISWPTLQILELLTGETQTRSGFLVDVFVTVGQWFFIGYLLDAVLRKIRLRMGQGRPAGAHFHAACLDLAIP